MKKQHAELRRVAYAVLQFAKEASEQEMVWADIYEFHSSEVDLVNARWVGLVEELTCCFADLERKRHEVSKKEPALIVIDRSTGTSVYWEQVPAAVRDIIELTRANWFGIGPPPTDFYMERNGDGMYTKYDVAYDLRPATLRTRLAWRMRWIAQKFEALADRLAGRGVE